jgi:hypothetical protein
MEYMNHFIVTSEGQDRLGLGKLCEEFANGLWVPAHYHPKHAAEFVLDQFRRSVLAELEVLEVHPNLGVG